jgi:hypothetical protein
MSHEMPTNKMHVLMSHDTPTNKMHVLMSHDIHYTMA